MEKNQIKVAVTNVLNGDIAHATRIEKTIVQIIRETHQMGEATNEKTISNR
jgi:hypothetical protein